MANYKIIDIIHSEKWYIIKRKINFIFDSFENALKVKIKYIPETEEILEANRRIHFYKNYGDWGLQRWMKSMN